MIIKKILKPLLVVTKKFLFLKIQNIKIKQPQKKVYIIKTDTIGDFVLFSAILPYFKKLYPQHKIVLIGDAVWQELAEWLQQNRILGGTANYFDELVPINGKFYNRNPLYYYKILKTLRLSSPEIVIQPTFSRTQKGDELVLISREAFKIGYDGDLSNIKKWKKEINDKKYDRLINNPSLTIETGRNKHFLNEVAGYKLLSSGLPGWKLNEKLLSEGKDFLSQFGVNLVKPIIVIFPSASHKIRCWPVSNFAFLLLKLFQHKPSLQFVLIGGPRDEKICSQIAGEKKMSNLPIFNICGRTKLSELAEILALARLYIGNETGVLHMASAIGISTICLLGGGHYGRFFPYPGWKKGAENTAMIHKMDCFNCNWKCRYKIRENKAVPCVQNIKVEEVYNQTIKLLSQTKSA